MEIMSHIDYEYVKKHVLPRDKNAHKGDCGRVLIIAGSYGMAGAAVLCGRAALKSGAGLVTIAIPDRIMDIVQVGVPEATCILRDELLSSERADYIRKFDAIVIGPGLGISGENMELIRAVLNHSNCPVILDADGINTLCEYDKEFASINNSPNRVILTPHPGEADRILRCAGGESIKSMNRVTAVRKLADFAGNVVLLKGKGTLVTKPGDEITCNTSGNPGMATGGSGDVLSGVIAALAALGMECQIAARTGAFMHGLAGDIAADKYGQWGMTAQDIASCLPEAFKSVVGI